MNSRNRWKTTDNPNGPSPDRIAKTFRDVSLAGLTPEQIDAIDAECIEREISRSRLARNIWHNNDLRVVTRLHELFHGARFFEKQREIIERIKNGGPGPWKTTDDPKGPSGRKVPGTFQDISLVGAKPEHIDEIDAECIARNTTRFGLGMGMLGTDEDLKRFQRLFRGGRHFKRMFDGWERDGILEPIDQPEPEEPT